MGILTNLVFQKGEYSFDDFTSDIRKRLYGGNNAAGVNVNEDTALRFITVFSCVRVLAEGVGSLPLFVYKKRRGGGKDKAEDHPVYRLLHDLPNDEMTSQSWRETMVGHLATSGNCYSILTRNKRGQVEDIYPVNWMDCTPVRNSDTGKIEYHINDRGKSEVFTADRVFHTPGFGFDGIMGYSPIRMAAEAVGIGMASSEFTAHFYKNGMNIGGVLEHPQALSDAAFARLQEWVNEKGVGLGNSWKPLILEEGMKFARIPMPFVDAQFIETRKLNRDEICGLFRVPPHMIANLERSTNNNIEHQGIEFVMHTLMPYLTRIEQTANWKLFTRAEREAGYYVKFNVDGLLRGDYKSRQEGLAIQHQNGALNADEWREIEDRNPIEDGTGKIYYVNSAAVPRGSNMQTSSEGGE
ncbi:phage portal protein, HK97 family [Paenibacillus dendritiformis C454]|uniref:Phage portal protein, HK97 family n=1 Tax=Paenibacillus dendritiformis C454 TaxID=1131935 RepID=H3SBI6_9BACL|nr:phage portal protein [Paenibacillus dendritiformis]EHQ63669.1 phage portal protein, HK97 family [Paenibacillus dendritiformis C454]